MKNEKYDLDKAMNSVEGRALMAFVLRCGSAHGTTELEAAREAARIQSVAEADRALADWCIRASRKEMQETNFLDLVNTCREARARALAESEDE